MRPLRLVSPVLLCISLACGEDPSAGSATESGTDASGGTSTGAGSSSSSSSDALPTTGGGACTPGAVQACPCEGAADGEQVCADDGAGWEPCACDEGPVCGDGEVQTGEACDDGVNDGGYGGCEPGCAAPGPRCGDGEVKGPEACDDGNDVEGDGCNTDCVISGSELWTVGYAGEDAGNARARGVAVDGAGNVVVVGEEFVVGENANVWVRKYTPAGEALWTWTWAGEDDGDDIAHAVAIAPGDDIVLVGETYVAGSGADVLIVRLGPAMEVKWTQTHDGPGGLGDRGFGVAVDPGGDIVVTGHEYALIGLHNAWTRRMDPQGVALWTDVYDANAGEDTGRAVAIAPDGAIVVVGDIYEPIGLADLWIRKYAPGGEEVWSQQLDHMLGNDRAHGVAVDAAGQIGVVGEVYEAAGLAAIYAGVWSPEGAPSWSQIQDSEGGDNDIGRGAAFDVWGDLIAVGEEYTANDFARVYVRKHAPAGGPLWTQVHDGDDAGDDVAWAVAAAADGAIYVAGEQYAVGQFADVWLRKYAP